MMIRSGGAGGMHRSGGGLPSAALGAIAELYDPARHAAAIGLIEGASRYTLGCEFSVSRANAIRCTGVRVYVGEAGQWRCKLWDQALGTASRTVDSATGVGPGLIEVLFSSPIILDPAKRYIATYYRLDEDTHFRIATPDNVPNPTSSSPEVSGSVNFYSFGRFFIGDTFPNDAAAANRYPVGPILENI